MVEGDNPEQFRRKKDKRIAAAATAGRRIAATTEEGKGCRNSVKEDAGTSKKNRLEVLDLPKTMHRDASDAKNRVPEHRVEESQSSNGIDQPLTNQSPRTTTRVHHASQCS